MTIRQGPVVVASAQGGMDIEAVAKADPSAILKLPIDIKTGIYLNAPLYLPLKLYFLQAQALDHKHAATVTSTDRAGLTTEQAEGLALKLGFSPQSYALAAKEMQKLYDFFLKVRCMPPHTHTHTH